MTMTAEEIAQHESTINYLEHIIPTLSKYVEGEDKFTALSIAMSLLANVVIAHNLSRRELYISLEALINDLEGNNYIEREVV